MLPFHRNRCKPVAVLPCRPERCLLQKTARALPSRPRRRSCSSRPQTQRIKASKLSNTTLHSDPPASPLPGWWRAFVNAILCRRLDGQPCDADLHRLIKHNRTDVISTTHVVTGRFTPAMQGLSRRALHLPPLAPPRPPPSAATSPPPVLAIERFASNGKSSQHSEANWFASCVVDYMLRARTQAVVKID